MSTKRARRFTPKTLKAACEQLRKMLVGQEVATPEEVASVWPGGPQNPGRPCMDTWIEAHASLRSFARRLELQTASTPDGYAERLEAAVHAAGMALPRAVRLADGTSRDVHPKGLRALSWIEGLGNLIGRITTASAHAIDTDAAEAILELPLARTMAVRVWLWILTTPGASVPWSDDDGYPTDPPSWTADVTPEDLLSFDRAHSEVNAERITIMASAFPSEPGERSRLGIGGMLAAHAHEHGLSLREVMDRCSIGEATAGAIAAAELHRVAKTNAEREAAHKP